MVITRKMLNVLGLLFGIIGVIIIFRYGPPQPDFSIGISLGIDSPDVAKHDAQIQAMRRTYQCWSQLGLGSILLGFVLQLIAAILEPRSNQTLQLTAGRSDV
jgi:drug/metabolite transporter (DMT)-like permease